MEDRGGHGDRGSRVCLSGCPKAHASRCSRRVRGRTCRPCSTPIQRTWWSLPGTRRGLSPSSGRGGPVFLERFPAVLNVHPSLLPDFRGLRAVERALEAGVEETGVTVHFMVEEVDAGPIVAQQRVPILPEDTKETLLGRLHPVEHRLLVLAVADYFLGRVKV